MQAHVYSPHNTNTSSTVTLPEEIFGEPWNNDLVHQVVTAMRMNARPSTAHAKDRSDVRGGGRKPWRQKGTGRARHGSIRSPIWVGGGVTHGPLKDRNYKKRTTRKMRIKALFSVLAAKYRDGELLFVDELSLSPKTKEARQALEAVAQAAGAPELATRERNAVYIAIPALSPETKAAFRNMQGVTVGDLKDVSPLDVLTHKYFIIAHPTDAIALLQEKRARVYPERASA